MGRLLLNGAFIARPLADVLHIGEKKGEKSSSSNKHCAKNEDVLFNPQNPVNPDSNQVIRGNFI